MYIPNYCSAVRKYNLNALLTSYHFLKDIGNSLLGVEISWRLDELNAHGKSGPHRYLGGMDVFLREVACLNRQYTSPGLSSVPL